MARKPKPFAFNLGQRVNVPGHKNVQGVIAMPASTTDMMASFDRLRANHTAGAAHIFFVVWTEATGYRRSDWFSVVELSAAQLADVDVTISDTITRLQAVYPIEAVATGNTVRGRKGRRRRIVRMRA